MRTAHIVARDVQRNRRKVIFGGSKMKRPPTDAGLLLFVLDSISEAACRAFVCDDMAAL